MENRNPISNIVMQEIKHTLSWSCCFQGAERIPLAELAEVFAVDYAPLSPMITEVLQYSLLTVIFSHILSDDCTRLAITTARYQNSHRDFRLPCFSRLCWFPSVIFPVQTSNSKIKLSCTDYWLKKKKCWCVFCNLLLKIWELIQQVLCLHHVRAT